MSNAVYHKSFQPNRHGLILNFILKSYAEKSLYYNVSWNQSGKLLRVKRVMIVFTNSNYLPIYYSRDFRNELIVKWKVKDGTHNFSFFRPLLPLWKCHSSSNEPYFILNEFRLLHIIFLFSEKSWRRWGSTRSKEHLSNTFQIKNLACG